MLACVCGHARLEMMTAPPDMADTRTCLTFIANLVDRHQWRLLIAGLGEGLRPSTRKTECAATLVAYIAHGPPAPRRQAPLRHFLERQQ